MGDERFYNWDLDECSVDQYDNAKSRDAVDAIYRLLQTGEVQQSCMIIVIYYYDIIMAGGVVIYIIIIISDHSSSTKVVALMRDKYNSVNV